MSLRPTLETRRALPTMEGAGVHLHRAFGFQDPSELDPFLLFDDFRNDRPEHYAKGFPWHPHRGIETITYVLSGTVDHADSLGNEGSLGAGDIQWMTAGSGILHQEMPKGNAQGQMHGFQLWANLPPARRARQRLALYSNGWHMLLRDLDAGVVLADIVQWTEDQAQSAENGRPLPSGADRLAQDALDDFQMPAEASVTASDSLGAAGS